MSFLRRIFSIFRRKPEPAKALSFITMASGVCLSIKDFRREHVKMLDMVRAISKQVRYMGHCDRLYTVAQHSLNCCRMAEYRYGKGSIQALCALMHDFHEAYMMDFPTPHKEAIPGYREVENIVQAVVRSVLGLPDEEAHVWEQVHELDRELLYIEANEMFDPPPPWAKEPTGEFNFIPIEEVPWQEVLYQLCNKLYLYGFYSVEGMSA